MSLANDVRCRIAYKAYASGLMATNAEADLATDPGASGGQILRRVSSSLQFQKAQYQSQEILQSLQLRDHRHGSRSVTGSLNCEYSPLTYKDLFEASFRGTWAAAISLSQVALTSAAFDATTSTVIFAAGDPIALGLRVGYPLRFGGTASNNGINYTITGFGGTSNRTVSIYPAPVTEGADTSFTVASIGKSLIIPSTGHVSRKFLFEHWFDDIDDAEVFTECRLIGFNMNLPATGIATLDFPVAGRDMVEYEESDAPYLTAPTAPTETGLFQAVNGGLFISGTRVGTVTGLTIGMAVAQQAPAVLGQNFTPDIMTGKAIVTGQLTALLENGVRTQEFVNETEVSLQAYLTTTNAVNAPANTVVLPRLKWTGAARAVQGDFGVNISLPYQALENTVATAGLPLTTIQLCDTEVV